MFTDMQIYGLRCESRTLPWAEYLMFLETLFICNNIDKNPNNNSHSQLSYHSLKPVIFIFLICAISSSKKFEKEKWPKAGYLSLLH